MPLTAAEVRATQFSTTRMKAGYDMDEVDAFLDIIEADVAQYVDELQRSRDGEAVLRTQCDQLQGRLSAAEQRLAELEAEVLRLRAGGAAPLPEGWEKDPEASSIVNAARAHAESITAAVRATLTEQLAQLDRR